MDFHHHWSTVWNSAGYMQKCQVQPDAAPTPTSRIYSVFLECVRGQLLAEPWTRPSFSQRMDPSGTGTMLTLEANVQGVARSYLHSLAV